MNDWDMAVSLPVAAMMTGFSHWTIRRAISLGELVAEQKGSQKYLRIDHLSEWAAKKKEKEGKR